MSKRQIDEKIKEIDEIVELLGGANADTLMGSANKTQEFLHTAMEFISQNQFTEAWDAIQAAERVLLEATLLWDEFLVKREAGDDE